MYEEEEKNKEECVKKRKEENEMEENVRRGKEE